MNTLSRGLAPAVLRPLVFIALIAPVVFAPSGLCAETRPSPMTPSLVPSHMDQAYLSNAANGVQNALWAIPQFMENAGRPQKNCTDPTPAQLSAQQGVSIEPIAPVEYECLIDDPPKVSSPHPRSEQRAAYEAILSRGFEAHFSSLNDNWALHGNDLGDTSTLVAGGSYKKGKNEWGVDYSSALYTANVASRISGVPSSNDFVMTDDHGNVLFSNKSTTNPDGSGSSTIHQSGALNPDGKTQDYTNSYGPMGQSATQVPYTYTNQGGVKGGGKEQESIRFLDVERGLAYWKHMLSEGKSGGNFYFEVNLGGESHLRDRDAHGNLPLGAAAQNGWHSKVLNIYTFDYVGPGYQNTIYGPPVTTVTTAQDIAVTYQNGKQILTPVKIVTTTTVNSVYRNEVPKEKLKEDIQPYSALIGANVGAKKVLFSGRCVVKAQAGMLIATQGSKDLLGPNSNVYGNAEVNSTVLRKKDGSPRLDVSAAEAVFFYPQAGAITGAHIGQAPEVGVRGYFGRSTRFSPFFSFKMPMGRLPFEEFQDAPKGGNQVVDPIGRVGFNIYFGQRKSQ